MLDQEKSEQEKKEREGLHLSKEISNYRLTTKAIDVFGKEIVAIYDVIMSSYQNPKPIYSMIHWKSESI